MTSEVATITPAPAAPAKPAVAAPVTVLRQVGFITKGGGLDLEYWIQKEKEANPGIVVKDFPDHIEFHVEEKKK